jgi:predicted membrane protein
LSNDRSAQSGTRVAWLPLLIALSIAVVVSVYPQAAMVAERADHAALMALFWSMTAGFVRGVGFVPVNFVGRWLCSATACYLGLALFVLRAWLG